MSFLNIAHTTICLQILILIIHNNIDDSPTILILVKLQSFVVNSCAMRKIWLCKVQKFVYLMHTWNAMTPGQAKVYKKLEDCIFCKLQYFATKLCSFTDSSMFLLAVVVYFHLLI